MLGFKDSQNRACRYKSDENFKLSKLNLNDIIQVKLPDNQYYRNQTKKNQIVLHHTVSGQGVNGDISWWRQTAARIGTAIIVGWDGKIYQCFSSRYWAHHLGIKNISNNVSLNKSSIGIEIDSWGGLTEYVGKWYPSRWNSTLRKNEAITTVKPIPKRKVVFYPNGYKGFYGYEKYTQKQIEAVRELLVYWNGVYKIPLTYNEDMFNVSSRALNGKSGIWSHTSFRSDKSDVHPQPTLIKMLKSLTKNECR